MKTPIQIAEGVLLDCELGEGATSVVYGGSAVMDLPFAAAGTQLAVKVFRRSPRGRDLERFEREVEIGLRLRSPYLCRYLSTGIYPDPLGDRPYIIIERIEGVPLPAYVRTVLALPSAVASVKLCRLVEGLLAALDVLHTNNIIHRDLQPANVLVREQQPVLLDFGTAKFFESDLLTSAWEELGTRRYWAPECISSEGERWTPATDLFMCGSLLVHVIGGEFLFSKAWNYPDFFAALKEFKHSEDPPPELLQIRAQVDRKLYQVLRMMLANLPENRPPAHELVEIVRTGGRGLPDHATDSFPLSELLWRLEAVGGVKLIFELAKRFERSARITPEEIVRICESDLGASIRMTEILAGLGLVRQEDEGTAYFHHWGPRGSDHEYGLLAPHLGLRPCHAALRLAQELSWSTSLWVSHRRVVEHMQRWWQKGSLRLNEYEDFKGLLAGDRLFIMELDDNDRVEFRVAVELGLLSPLVIDDLEIRRYETWGSYL
jgi:serine/threonine protein kinase